MNNEVKEYVTNLQEENKKSFEEGYTKGIITAELDNENEFIVAYKELEERINKGIEYLKAFEGIEYIPFKKIANAIKLLEGESLEDILSNL